MRGLFWRNALPDGSAVGVMLRRDATGQIYWQARKMAPLDAPYWPGPVALTRVGWLVAVVDGLTGLTVHVDTSLRAARQSFHARFCALSRAQQQEYRSTLDTLCALLAPGPRPRVARVGDLTFDHNQPSE